MSVTPPCEISVKEILPAVRSIIATKLVKEKGLPLYEAAKKMGVTPAAVANYMNKKRGNSVRELIEHDKKMMDMISDFVEKVYIGTNEDLSNYYCMLCSEGKKVLKRSGVDVPLCAYESSLILKR